MYRESLYSRPSLLTGIARLFDFWGVFDSYNSSSDAVTADARAIGSDWCVVGEDIRDAIRQYEDTHPPAEQIELFAQPAKE